MNDRRRTTRSISTAVATLLLALGWQDPSAAVEIKVASVAPDGSHWMQQMRAGAEEIRAQTGGRVTIRFYPGGIMGNDAQVLRKIRVGQLHGGAFTASGLGERYGALNLYGIPLLFRSFDEVDYVRERLDPTLQAGLEEAGFVSFGFVEGGFANLMAGEPIRTVEQLKSRKVWVPEGDQISYMAMEALGLSPVTLPITDVLTGLQTELLDVIAATPVAALVLQWHTKVRYVTDLPASYVMGVFALDRRVFASLSEADQQVVREVMSRVTADLDRTARMDDREARVALEQAELEYVMVEPADVERWRRTVETIYPALRRRPDIDAELLDRLLALLAEYRAAHRPSSSG